MVPLPPVTRKDAVHCLVDRRPSGWLSRVPGGQTQGVHLGWEPTKVTRVCGVYTTFAGPVMALTVTDYCSPVTLYIIQQLGQLREISPCFSVVISTLKRH